MSRVKKWKMKQDENKQWNSSKYSIYLTLVEQNIEMTSLAHRMSADQNGFFFEFHIHSLKSISMKIER